MYDFSAHGHHLAHRSIKGNHDACHMRRYLDRRLVGHHVGQDLVFCHHVAHFDVSGAQFNFGNAFANVRHFDCL